MQFICHRINNAGQLADIPREYGVELDLRDDLDGRVYIEHNPFTPGEDFEEYLESYHHGTMILNVKSERIEHKVLELIEGKDVKDYFFLDSSFPMIYLLSTQGNFNTALRFSEFEGLDTVRNMAGRAKWVWADCFTKTPLTKENSDEIRSLGYKICIVSPELQGRSEDIEKHAEYFKSSQIVPDAICTKIHNIPLWKKYFQ